MRKGLLSTLVGAGLMSASVLASNTDISTLEVSYSFNIEGALDCEIISAPVVDLGSITHQGVFTSEQDLVFTCADALDFGVAFDESPTNTGIAGGIYEDDYIHVYIGTRNQVESDGNVFTRGHASSTNELGCRREVGSNWYGSSVRVNNISIYPIASKYNTNSSNRNNCWLKWGTSDDGEYRVPLTTAVRVKEIPPLGVLEELQTEFVIPVSLYAITRPD